MNEDEIKLKIDEQMNEFINKLNELHEKLLIATPEERKMAMTFLKKMTRLNADIRPE